MATMRRIPSPALLVSIIALCVSLGGTSYAITKLPKKSVGNAQIKNNAVTSNKVKDGSLLARDFKSGQLPSGAKGDVGAQGQLGPSGSPGAAGAAGATGLTGATGPTGAPGTPGLTGATGATGAVGVLANGYSNNESDHSFDDNGGNVLDLTGPDAHSGPITVASNARLYVTFSTEVYEDNSGGIVICQMGVDGEDIGYEGSVNLMPQGNAPLVMSGVLEVGPGTYNPAVGCRTEILGNTATVTGSVLTVLALPG